MWTRSPAPSQRAYLQPHVPFFTTLHFYLCYLKNNWLDRSGASIRSACHWIFKEQSKASARNTVSGILKRVTGFLKFKHPHLTLPAGVTHCVPQMCKSSECWGWGFILSFPSQRTSSIILFLFFLQNYVPSMTTKLWYTRASERERHFLLLPVNSHCLFK